MAFIEREVKGQAYRVLTETTVQNGEEVNSYDKISMWTDASDVDLGEGQTLADIIVPIKDNIQYARGTLLPGQSAVVVKGSNITPDGMLDVYVPSKWCKLTPERYSDQTSGSVTIYFPIDRTYVDTDGIEKECAESIEVRVVCKNLTPASGIN